MTNTPTPLTCWVNTISRAHVLGGVAGGFTQADHGRPTRLRKLRRGDRIVFYSPRTEFGGGEPLQAFTALGIVEDDEPYQVEVTPDFQPWRRRVAFDVSAHEVLIRPLLDDLSFISDPKRWGFVFRRGLFAVPCEDLERIAAAMGVPADATPRP